MASSKGLIFDVGLFDGSDTDYYLFRGYDVVSIDANPMMIDKAKVRFAKEIAEGRLTLLNAGVGDKPGSATFWVSELPEWSSFDPKIAGRDGMKHTAVAIPVLPFSEILKQYPHPHYVKVDIEGHDRLCVQGLDLTKKLPQYFSVESECANDHQVLSDAEATEMLVILKNAGYKRFKMVSQYGWIPVRPNPNAAKVEKLVNSMTRGRLKLPVISGLLDGFTDIGKIESVGYKFLPGSTGPWGEDIPGPWMEFDEARETYLRTRHAYFADKNAKLHSFWYDWHATI